MSPAAEMVLGIQKDGYTVVSVAVCDEAAEVLADEMGGFKVLQPAKGEEFLVTVVTKEGVTFRATLSVDA